MAVSLPDAPVIITGDVLQVAPRPPRDGKPQGVQVLLSVAGDVVGFARINVRQDDLRTFPELPTPGSRVAWYVRNSPYEVFDSQTGQSNTGMSTLYVRQVVPEDLDLVGRVLAPADAK